MEEGNFLALEQSVCCAGVLDADIHFCTVKAQIEGVMSPLLRDEGRKMVLSAVKAHAREAACKNQPCASHAGRVDADVRVAVDVVQIHACGLAEIAVGFVGIADFGGDDGVNAGRKRAVMDGQRLVEIKDLFLHLRREVLAAKINQQHDVRLLDDLKPPEIQGMQMIQQRELLNGDALNVDGVAVENLIVLQIELQFLVVGNVHVVRRALPECHFLVIHAAFLEQLDVFFRILLPEQTGVVQRVIKHLAAQPVCIAVVVDNGRIFIRAADPVDAEFAALVFDEVAAVSETFGGLKENLGAVIDHEVLVVRDLHIALDGVIDVRVDVILCGRGLEDPCAFFAVDGGPRKQRALIVHLPRTLAGFVEGVVAVDQKLFCDLRLRVKEYGGHEDLRVPERPAAVAAPGQAVGGDVCDAVAACALI